MVLVRKSLIMQVDGPSRGRGRLKMMWMEVVKIDLKNDNLSSIWLIIDWNGETKFM